MPKAKAHISGSPKTSTLSIYLSCFAQFLVAWIISFELALKPFLVTWVSEYQAAADAKPGREPGIVEVS